MPFPASFILYFSSFQQATSNLDSNRRPLLSEVTALPTEPHLLPNFSQYYEGHYDSRIVISDRNVYKIATGFVSFNNSMKNLDSMNFGAYQCRVSKKVPWSIVYILQLLPLLN